MYVRKRVACWYVYMMHDRCNRYVRLVSASVLMIMYMDNHHTAVVLREIACVQLNT